MPSPRLLLLVAAFATARALPAAAQTTPVGARHAATAATARPSPSSAHPSTNPERPVPASLRPYLSCKLPIGPDLVQHTMLPQAPMARTAQTFSGPKKIELMDGVMAAFAYPGEQPFANVKVELLPAATFTAEKTDLVSEFDKINAAGNDTQRNYGLKPTLNGFDIQGFDRTALDGKVLGIYLLFDNPRHVASTIYFLNAPVGQRKFDSLNDYTALREGFLNAYTVCVRKAISGAPATAKPAAHPVARKPVGHTR